MVVDIVDGGRYFLLKAEANDHFFKRFENNAVV